ncbi:hypothetical protein PQC06_gp017 [Aeromonas phage LAh10]|uniref:Virion structural protein n=1 Tax=Aeromonas phage LAh10 TaxID=2591025 RepID=A0A514A1H7_9CAUD|nr:hypothetical protein PQC06_gp017 [Aeromonas phage LAh10]QDH47095.1 hypothetical protein LAh10_17 [Aeromonas phage LAh10]
MILIKNTKKEDVSLRLENEINYVGGLLDTIRLLNKVSPDQWNKMADYANSNAVMKSIEAGVKKGIHPKLSTVDAISAALSNLAIWMPKLKDRLKKSSTKIFDTETITFRERGILDAISAVNFFNRYASMYLDILLEQGYKKSDISKLLTRHDLTFFNDTAKHFVTILVRFNQSVKDLEGMLDALSEELADEMSEQILGETTGAASVSIRHGLAPHQLNPVYWYRLWRMERDVKSIEVNQKRIEILAMKIARLNNQRTGQDDPALDNTINIYQDKIIKMDAEIREIVEKHRG